MKKPTQEEIHQWTKNKVTKWYLERLANYLNEIDTVRNVKKGDELIGRQAAINIIEDSLGDIYEAGKLKDLQKRIAEKEDNVIFRVRNTEY
jgi:hypothetical protein